MEKGKNSFAMIALYLDGSVFCGASGAAVTLERLGDALEFARGKTRNDAHGSPATALFEDPYHAVIGQPVFHARRVRQAAETAPPNGGAYD